MNAAVQSVILLSVAAGAAWATFQWHPRAPALYALQEPLRDDEVTVQQIQEQWKGQVLWLDARPRDQYYKEHVPGALMLNEQEFDAQLFELLGTLQTNTKPIIIYCSGQRCEASRNVREKLVPLISGAEAFILKGGWPAWKAAQSQ